jgi:hypothetical protein
MYRILILFGSLALLAGLLWPWLGKIPWLRLPGDIVVDRPGFKFFFPFTTMLLASAVLSLLAWLMRR